MEDRGDSSSTAFALNAKLLPALFNQDSCHLLPRSYVFDNNKILIETYIKTMSKIFWGQALLARNMNGA
jgi:hypothetical protein